MSTHLPYIALCCFIFWYGFRALEFGISIEHNCLQSLWTPQAYGSHKSFQGIRLLSSHKILWLQGWSMVHAWKPSCSVSDKGAFWPLADLQWNSFFCGSENDSNAKFTKQLPESVKIICSWKMCTHVSEREYYLVYPAHGKPFLQNLVCVFIFRK